HPGGSRTPGARQPGHNPAVYARVARAPVRRVPREPSEGLMPRGAKAEVTPDLADLWAEFKKTASPEARERLILHYAPMVKYVAGRLRTRLPRAVQRARLGSSGAIGLIDARRECDME